MHRLTYPILPSRQFLKIIPSRHPLFRSASTQSRKERREHLQPESKQNWREMFRSTDYDDAWSPYVPFDSNGSTDTTINDDLNESATCQNPMKALIEGRWKKRRHGMNLVPLKMHFRDDNASKSCEDHTALQNSIALNQGRLKWLDSQTRFLSSMLDDLYRTGIRRQIDASRTERCHRIIGKLLTLTPSPSSENYKQLPFAFSGLAERAAAILDKMERCSPVSLKHHDPDVLRIDVLQTANRLDDRVPQHLQYTKQALSYPTKNIYNMVLLLFAKQSGPKLVAQNSEDVVWSMTDRYLKQTKLNTHKRGQKILPSKENWDCVLRCWSKCTDSDRSVYAYAFLESWLVWCKFLLSQSNADVNIPEPDIHSYHLVLESCIVDYGDERAIELGSRIVSRIWDEKEKSAMFEYFDSETYFLMLRPLCNSIEQSSRTSSKSRALMKKVFEACCKDGLLTVELLDIVRSVLPNSEFKQLLGISSGILDKEKQILSTERIMEKVPTEWFANAI